MSVPFCSRSSFNVLVSVSMPSCDLMFWSSEGVRPSVSREPSIAGGVGGFGGSLRPSSNSIPSSSGVRPGNRRLHCLDDILLVLLVNDEPHLAVRAVKCLDTALLKVAAHGVADEVQVLLRWDGRMSVVERVYATRLLGSVLLEPIEGGIALVLLTREGLCIDGPVHVLIELEHFAVLALTALIELQLSVIIEAGTYAVFGEYRLEILQVAALLTCCEHLVSNEGGVVVRVVGEVMALPPSRPMTDFSLADCSLAASS